MDIKKSSKVLKDGKEITLYQMQNDNGMMIEAMNLGGIITKIMVKDKEGKFENVVLEWEELDTYLTNPGYFGAIIGRTGGRIHKAQATIDGKVFNFPKNDNGNELHGGTQGFDKKIWNVEESLNSEEVILKLSYISEDGEEGYPGRLETTVFYILNNQDELIIKYEATTDKTTLANLTQHAYFNLSGDAKRPVTGHEVYINSNEVCELDNEAIPTGKMIDLNKDSIFDFRQRKTIGQDIEKEHIQFSYVKGYDHPWVLNEEGLSAECYDPISGRSMEITTNQKALVMYTMNHPNENKLSSGEPANRRYAVCFETQALPIGYNEINKEGSILEKGQKYYHQTKFAFKIK